MTLATALPPQDRFADRHLGPRAAEVEAMLNALGVESLDDLVDSTVPSHIRTLRPLSTGNALSEVEALAKIGRYTDENQVFRSYLGMGYHDTITPGVILRNILENPGWYTQYTPYQAEISQGRMEALLLFQTMVSDLTGLPIANASLLDEATAAAEAMTMSHGLRKDDAANAFFVAENCHPQVIEVVRTRAEPLGVEVIVGDPALFDHSSAVFGVLLQYPTTDGAIWDDRAFVQSCRERGIIVTVAADILSLVLLEPPGSWGADICVGSAQRFGVPLGYGGPHAAFFACRDEFKRQMPGRLIGVSIDSSGKPALRLTLQTREQHIRREKATSNICTAQVLLAIISAMYAVYHGPAGLKRIAGRVHSLSCALASGLRDAGFPITHAAFFDTLRVEAGAQAPGILAAARSKQINLRDLGQGHIAIALDEKVVESDLSDILNCFGVITPTGSLDATSTIPTAFRRTSPILTHAHFNRYHSETEMLRFITRLQSRDLSLTATMIPLGSCTMKLNATAEMIPVTWQKVGGIHPFAPTSQTKGYARLFADLENWLADITGFAATSLQPNAGSQGEYAGLLAIRAYHRSRGDHGRNVCLIPQSAHGTNPASAALAGMSVVVVKCDTSGNIDVADLRTRAVEHRDRLAALMVTYPSTHGVFEAAIKDICQIIHENGGQVYMDGANLNALVGLVRPGELGADVCHINLHKTFCIPHGGGGPGMGPICCGEHLAPFLPGHSVVPMGGGTSAVSAAPWGSSSILPISWMYIAMMGHDGLTLATKIAILSANYLAKRLAPHYPVLYTGANGRVAHECILDLRPIKAASGIEVVDIAKRLMDYGFHAPTVSFPVVGTLMVEPTESESLAELDRFIDAMIAIRGEITKVEQGEWSKTDNPLKQAPHTSEAVTATEWNRPYSRELAAFPSPHQRSYKFWPPIGRVNDVYGDKNVMCSCPPIEEYAAK